MAFLQCDFISMCLNRDSHFNVYLPGDRGESTAYPLRSLFLLHDYFGSCWDCMTLFSPEKLAEKYNIAVIMPDGENHFFADDLLKTELYAKYVGSELTEFTRRMLPISNRADETFICGVGMGGYGALHVGLTYPGELGHIIAIDPTIVFGEYERDSGVCQRLGISERDHHSIFGDVPSDSNDLYKNVADCTKIPDISLFYDRENAECSHFDGFLTEKNIPHRSERISSDVSALVESVLENK